MVIILDLGDGRITERHIGPAVSNLNSASVEQIKLAAAAYAQRQNDAGALSTFTDLTAADGTEFPWAVGVLWPDRDAERPETIARFVGPNSSTIRDDDTFAELVDTWAAGDPTMLRERAREECGALGCYKFTAGGNVYWGMLTNFDVFGDLSRPENIERFLACEDPDALAKQAMTAEAKPLAAWIVGDVYIVTVHDVRTGSERSLSGVHDDVNHAYAHSVACELAGELA